MIQSLRMISLWQHSWTSVLSVSFVLAGCTTPTELPVNPVTRSYSGSDDGSAHRDFRDPFRQPQTTGLKVDRRNTSPPYFTWDIATTTASGEPLQITSVGDGGFRSLVVGSIGGDDRAAVKLTEELARYVHRNRLIVGGVSTTILRTLNPDGMKLGGYENSNGIYLNRKFPESSLRRSSTEFRRLPKEIQFLINLVDDHRPQRIIHLRTVRGSRGMLAASYGAENSGREVAEWLDFKVRHLPEDVSDGTLEFWAAHRTDCEVITIGIPRHTKSDEVWSLYGDAVLSMLLEGNSARRRMVRTQPPSHWTQRQYDTSHHIFPGRVRENSFNDYDVAPGFTRRMFD
ncbi:MAG: hypothetical protein MK110_17255 [Fuerstiella sp.]|nr:hypothetical protein [Fuerstiella sp.]